MRINKYVLYQLKKFLKLYKNFFYSHGSIWDTFIKKFFLANFLQIHGSSWNTFIKKKFSCGYKKINNYLDKYLVSFV